MTDPPAPDTPGAPDASSEDREREEAARWAEIVAHLTGADGPQFADPVPFRSWSPAEEPEEHYQPPEPPPVPRMRRGTTLSLAALIAGVVLLVVPTLFGQPLGGGFAGLAVLAMIGGAAGLVYQLRPVRDDSGPDDGAVV